MFCWGGGELRIHFFNLLAPMPRSGRVLQYSGCSGAMAKSPQKVFSFFF